MEAIQEFIANILPLLRLGAIVLGAYAVLLWAASVLWAYRDIRRRTEDVSVQVLAVGIVLLLPFLGIPLHLILRPPQTLAEKYERTLEEEFLRRDLEDQLVCPECQRPIEPDFIICPHCHTQLRRHCDTCGRVIDLTWRICPYCGSSQTRGVATRAESHPVVPPVGVSKQ
ncbi:MAG: hypothetical protein KatS3mg055_0373 [Chloroflexus sp.]|jgi:RNA polymerase subunit RPABC4/transcription elongation factor Spt4|uniref:zinc ribbon domain-containing protein n=1 Tax=Chloroflexus sp. TaxID=1904827 RepID=UPI0021DE48A0|nr:zinc ribbon domain-containing protein [Chloroflexus sp.]GIV87855.1 MAG: hypothetical protein KatS3mg055_0373 [Chloroflexus sp.]